MNVDLQKGKLKRWNDDKGFGFIATADRRKDRFVHISALKRMGRRPTVGDVIIYHVHTDHDGRERAVNARIEGVAEVTPRPIRKGIKKKTTSTWLTKALSFAIVILLGSVAYKEFTERNYFQKEPIASTPANVAGSNKNNYSCAGKIYCSEMTSCNEAKFYLRNCPGTKMDGDHDGIPCESQWCGW